MPLIHNLDVPTVDMMPGVVRKNLTDGEKMMLVEVQLAQGSVVPSHTHPHEQTGYLVSGRVRFQIGDEVQELAPGDAWMIPGGVPHEVTTLETAVALDIFSPPREDFR